MNLYINNHGFHYELENLARLFFPNEKINVIKNSVDYKAPCIITCLEDKLCARVRVGEFCEEACADLSTDSENELSLCRLVYRILCRLTGVNPPWGMLTGVRPIKLYRSLKEEMGQTGADKYFKEKLFVSDEKLSLARETERHEKKITDLSQDNSFSLYIAIPFCPSRCSYCSFVQSSVEKSGHLIEPYVELLCRELQYTAQIASKLSLKLETVYMGGGTPTTLSPAQLNRVLSAVRENFDMNDCREFTVEAGRPDTITEEKLYSLKENKVDRISINPQTLNDSVLKVIGRRHTAEQTLEALDLARRVGFKSINMDLIAGLPSETLESFCCSLDEICRLSPQCITVHTLSMKRSSALTQDGSQIDSADAKCAADMLNYAFSKLTGEEYIPYYLYRQSRMVGNLENTGWSKPGFESLYNVYVMDETHTILGCGAGAVTKLKAPGDSYLKRIFNFKYPYEYNGRFNELLERKGDICIFYENYI